MEEGMNKNKVLWAFWEPDLKKVSAQYIYFVFSEIFYSLSLLCIVIYNHYSA